MSFREWIYGPAIVVDPIGSASNVQIRPTTIELDTAIEVARLAEEHARERVVGGTVNTTWQITPGTSSATPNPPRTVAEDTLPTLGDVDRSRLILAVAAKTEGGIQVFSTTVDFRESTVPFVHVNDSVVDNPHAASDFAQMLASKIVEDGTPRLNPSIWARIGIQLPAPLLAVLWVSTLLTHPLPLAAMLFGLALIVTVALAQPVLARHYESRRSANLSNYPGIRIRSISRHELDLHRANLRTNVKVIAITAPISIAIGVIGTALAFFLGFSGSSG